MKEVPLVFDRDGLAPVVIQDDTSLAVLMIAFMNREALDKTRETGSVHFWSRSRQQLWRKGETSGHTQIVRSIHVNCYENSLLIRVDQTGAACHTGYPTCYYREITADGQFVETVERVFNPEEVYGDRAQTNLAIWVGAYRWLADKELTDASSTSKLLHTATPACFASRISDELRELAGVLVGNHRHASVELDVRLEGMQVLYWIALTAIGSGLDNAAIETAIDWGQANPSTGSQVQIPEQLTGLAASWLTFEDGQVDGLIRDTVSVLTRAAEVSDSTISAMVESDLVELKTRTYLDNYFSSGTC